jgi:UPF0755 protein
VGYFLYSLAPQNKGNTAPREIQIASGEHLYGIAAKLQEEHIIRSAPVFVLFSFVTGQARTLQPGEYLLSSASSTPQIIAALGTGVSRDVAVTIPEGSSIYDIDRLLSDADIVQKGSLISYAEAHALEGQLFPDTYAFFKHSTVPDVVTKLTQNFTAKTSPLLQANPEHFKENLILASILEVEVPDAHDRQIVAGILNKRILKKMPLQVDATVCYVKKQLKKEDTPCYPLTPLDFKIDSPYNTYLYRGLPPGPISNPGLLALEAATQPLASPYWFYLSDPRTKKTFFSATLAEQEAHRATYLQ